MTPGAFPAPRPILCRGGGGSWECHRYVILTTPVVSSFPIPPPKKGEKSCQDGGGRQGVCYGAQICPVRWSEKGGGGTAPPHPLQQLLHSMMVGFGVFWHGKTLPAHPSLSQKPPGTRLKVTG